MFEVFFMFEVVIFLFSSSCFRSSSEILNFVIQIATTIEKGVHFCQKTIGAIRYDVR